MLCIVGKSENNNQLDFIDYKLNKLLELQFCFESMIVYKIY